MYDTPRIDHHITNLAVVRESTEGGDVLDREVSLRRSRADVALLSDPVDLLVELYQTTIMSHITYHITTSGISGVGGAGRGTYELGCCFVVSVLYHQRSSHAVQEGLLVLLGLRFTLSNIVATNTEQLIDKVKIGLRRKRRGGGFIHHKT